jgi:hypothetical protein
MAFHDLTPNQSAPQAAKSLLGLGSKFIVKPTLTTGCIEKTTDRLNRDFKLRVYFAGDDDEIFAERDKEQSSKLRIKSTW